MDSKRLHEILSQAERAASRSERARLCRGLLRGAVDSIYERAGTGKPPSAGMLELLDSAVVTGFVNDEDMMRALHYVRILGMRAEHGAEIREKEAALCLRNAASLVELLEARENGREAECRRPPYMSEAETRRLYIDLYLREAGWDVLETKNEAQPGKAAVEVRVEGMPPGGRGSGFCDYVLYGRDGRPLAIVEAKKASVSPEAGRHQADLYGECMKARYGYKPVLYYTNGYETRVIDGLYPDRKVMGFHSLSDLELLMERRRRKDIADFSVKAEIANRHYQITAVRHICERLNRKHRRGLLVMATGTGKTRVAIALVDVLARGNWVKNVLFLADRTSLVSQARRSFNKLLPGMTVCELSGSGGKDLNARLMFSTYQTMINYIDAEEKRFSIGRFDLIVIDEAHRSIFNKYGAVFDYFDSFLVGLTATPKDEVEANTYRIFGCESGEPDYDYTLEQAVKEKFLVGYRVVSRTSRLIKEGLDDLDKLPEEKRELLKDYVERDPSSGLKIPGSRFFRELYNEDTCRQVLEDLMVNGLKVDNGETLGKSVIFAYNHRHAQMIVDCFHELYPEYPANTCQLVDNYVKFADSLILDFEEKPAFRIAVSVDMLDTGVDVPSILNLVFFKPVRSKIKFVQMIGRGTRLCKDLYGPGRHKDDFYIFDYCGNFEFFKQLEEGGGSEKPRMFSLTQRLFVAQLHIVHNLQDGDSQKDEWLRNFYTCLKRGLYEKILEIKSHGNRIQVRGEMRYVDQYCDEEQWRAVSEEAVGEISTHLVPLLDNEGREEPRAIAFDCRMFQVILAVIRDGHTERAKEHVKNVVGIARYLWDEKSSIPQVRARAGELRMLADNEFWSHPRVSVLERLRESLRGLMRFLEGRGRKLIDVDIKDVITGSPLPGKLPPIDIRTYRQKVMDYLKEHIDSPVISKIHHLEPVTEADLRELERIMWSELGSREDYEEAAENKPLAAFVRSVVGLDQETVNEKFGRYLNGSSLNAAQQEFVHTIIDYVRANGDVTRERLLQGDPFKGIDISGLFGEKQQLVRDVIDELHNPITASAA